MAIKDYLYLGAIMTLLAGFGFYTYHERQIGEHTIVKKDTAAAIKQETKNKNVENAINEVISKAITPEPVLPSPSIVCVSTKTTSSSVSPVPSTKSSNDGNTKLPEKAATRFNPSPAVLKDGADADAQIQYLQGIIKAMQDQGVIKRN